jgi:hypothetical protein
MRTGHRNSKLKTPREPAAMAAILTRQDDESSGIPGRKARRSFFKITFDRNDFKQVFHTIV